jgi:hypothetical protein
VLFRPKYTACTSIGGFLCKNLQHHDKRDSYSCYQANAKMGPEPMSSRNFRNSGIHRDDLTYAVNQNGDSDMKTVFDI